VKKPIPRVSNPQFDAQNEPLLQKDFNQFQKRNTVKGPEASNSLSQSPLMGRRGKQQINLVNSEENVRFGPYWNGSAPEPEVN
jgi:hypothetical protein